MNWKLIKEKVKCSTSLLFQFSSVQSLSHVLLFATPWIAARQASLSITISRSSLKLMSIESVMPSSHLILDRPLLLLPPIPPSIRVFSNSQLFAWGVQSTGASALASFLPKKSQGWSPSEWTGWNSRVIQLYIHTWILSHILFCYGLLQDCEYNSLCYTVGPCCLPISYVAACIY